MDEPLLSPVEIKNLKTLKEHLPSTRQITVDLSRNITATSTSTMCARRQMGLADVVGSNSQASFTDNKGITAYYSGNRPRYRKMDSYPGDTYLQAIESSKQLMASKILDYFVVDINVYRYQCDIIFTMFMTISLGYYLAITGVLSGHNNMIEIHVNTVSLTLYIPWHTIVILTFFKRIF